MTTAGQVSDQFSTDFFEFSMFAKARKMLSMCTNALNRRKYGNVLFLARAISIAFWLTRISTSETAMAPTTKAVKLIRTGAEEDESPAQNIMARIARTGPAAEMFRRMNIERLKGHMDAFYEHGTLPDIMLLCAAFDAAERECKLWSPERAWLVDSLLMLCGR
jgi:hypothetical protein